MARVDKDERRHVTEVAATILGVNVGDLTTEEAVDIAIDIRRKTVRKLNAIKKERNPDDE